MAENTSESLQWSSSAMAEEDVVQAFLEYLVAPMLPLKSFGRELPSLPQQQSVAKQVHAVVLLYNYYHRKRHAKVEFLGFKSFCKLAVTLKPTLMGHMKLMHQTDYTQLDDVEDQLSMMERAIMNACDISSALDASENAPSTVSWEISKVAVLLTDSSKENCLLQFGTITHGVWSVIEKDIEIPGVRHEGIGEGKHIKKRKRNNRKTLREDVNADEAGYKRLALSAVKEATGIKEDHLVILESHVVYSLSKEKSAAQFYIVQCIQPNYEDLQLSIKDVIKSLQGPLVRKINCSLAVTPVVEYFHVLPYAGILTDWFSREVFSNSLQDLRVRLDKEDVKSSQSIGNFSGNEDRDDSKSKTNAAASTGMEASGTDTMNLKQKNDNANVMVCSTDSYAGSGNMDMVDSPMVCSNRGVGLQDVNAENSERIDNLSVEKGNKDGDDCNENTNGAYFVANESSRTYTEALKQMNDNGSVMVCMSGSFSGSQNVGIPDSSIVYCLRAGESDNVDIKSRRMTDNLFDEEVNRDGNNSCENTNRADSIVNKKSGTNTESSKLVNDNGSGKSGLPDCHVGKQNMNIDNSSIIHYHRNRGKRTSNIARVCHHGKTSSSPDGNVNAETGGLKVKMGMVDSLTSSCVPKFKDGKADTGDEIRSTFCSDQDGLIIGDHALVPSHLNAEYLDKLKVTLASKENMLSQTALRFLLRKRYKLSHQLRSIGDEIAVCDKNIQIILDGGEKELAVKVEAIVDASDDLSLKGEPQEWTCYEDQDSSKHRRKRLSETAIASGNLCKELDDICYNNCWTIPTYHVYPVNGGFQASVNLKGMDFEYSEESDLCFSPPLGRESAAGKMIAKLQSVGGQSQ